MTCRRPKTLDVDAKQATWANVERRGRGAGLIKIEEDLRCMLMKRPASLGQMQSMGRAIEQRGAQIGLQAGYVA